MQRHKIIIIVIGFIILIGLSLTMFILDRDTSSNLSESSNINVSDEDEETPDNSNDGNENMHSINIQDDKTHAKGQNDEDVNQSDDRELRAIAQEAIESANIDKDADEMNEDTLYDHALLYQSYTLLRDENLLEKDYIELDSEWMALELLGWNNHAHDKYQFNYSLTEFIQFIEDNNYLNEDDLFTTILLDELKSRSENLYHRQLEIHYLKPFIWENIQDEVASNFEMDHPSNQDEDYQLFFSFEEEVINNLLKEHPEFFQEE